MKIKIYTLSTCPYCKKAKEFLKKHNIKFEEIRVDNNEEAVKEMYKKSKQYGVPVIEVKKSHGTGIIVGFDRQQLKHALDV